jgi:hypothetical protein
MTKDRHTISRELKEQMKRTDRLINAALRGMRLVNLTAYPNNRP